MAEIFVSYARTEREIAAEITRAFELEGFTVFYDANLVSGETWDQRIENELAAARVVVVLWSEASRDRQWVRNEAREALARGILCPVLIGTCAIPVEFSHIQSADLRGARGVRTHVGWSALVKTVRTRIQTGRPTEGESTAWTLPRYLSDQQTRAIELATAEHSHLSLASLPPEVRLAAESAREAELRALQAKHSAIHAAALAATGLDGFSVATSENSGNQEQYQGQVRDGKRSGYGIYRFFAQSADAATLCYEGQFHEGVRSGYGVCSWRSGNRYSGCLLNAEKSGWGIEASHGHRYEGAYALDKPNGFGVWWDMRTGGVRAGIFVDGRHTRKSF